MQYEHYSAVSVPFKKKKKNKPCLEACQQIVAMDLVIRPQTMGIAHFNGISSQSSCRICAFLYCILYQITVCITFM